VTDGLDLSQFAQVYSDAARRCSDTIRTHIVAGMAGRWCAIRLSDGGSDGVVYDTRADAVGHQLHEQQCAYVLIPYDDMSPRAAEAYLRFHRSVYDAGMRLVDPERPNIGLVLPHGAEYMR
jgi:hypothetical protein